MLMNNEKLRKLCIDKGWFTCGSNHQYDKLFDANDNDAPLNVIATIIWVCSEDVTRGNIILEIIDSIDRDNDDLLGYLY